METQYFSQEKGCAMTKESLTELLKTWPSAFVARIEAGRFSGGLVSSKSLANHDSEGTGPPRLKVGGRVAYRAADLVAWLQARCRA
jgi:hypothetical protein